MTALHAAKDSCKRRFRSIVGIMSGLGCCLCILLCWGWGMVSCPGVWADSQDRSEGIEPVFSLDVRNMPLVQVLDQIERETGRRLVMEPSWNQYPITVSFRNFSLGSGLKRVLANLNHAVIYESQQEIRIVIFGEAVNQSAGSVSRPRSAPVMPDAREDESLTQEDDQEEEAEPENPQAENPSANAPPDANE